MSIYVWYQNNSGGFFTLPARGIVVDAPSEETARDYAVETWGVTFDDPADCSCCGSRWSSGSVDVFQSLKDAVKEIASLYEWDGSPSLLYVSGKAQGK